VIDETLLDAEEKMEKAVTVAKDDFGSIRTGRATPAMFNKIVVDYYGALTPVNQLASLNVPEPRMAIVQPYDKASLNAIIRIVFPQLTQERRKDLTKVARSKAEDAKISIRNIRRRAKEELDRLVKDGETGEDDVARAEKELEKTTAQYVASVDELLRHKEAELLEV
jgi:ribosome recycling factor